MKLPSFEKINVLVVGDVMLDKYWFGTVNRISPEAPVPVLHLENEIFRLGGAGNVAINAASLGAKVYLLGLVGSDSSADIIDTLLINKKIHSKLIRNPDIKTITKLRLMSRNHQLLRVDVEDFFTSEYASLIINDFVTLLNLVDIVILSDYAKGTLFHSEILIEKARNAGKQVIVDPKGNDFSKYRNASVVTPNFIEFENVVGSCVSETEVECRGIELRDKHNFGALLITRSEKGLTLLSRGDKMLNIPTRARQVYDVTGAGDTFVATLSIALSSGMSLKESAEIANHAAGIVVSKIGTSLVTKQELDIIVNNFVSSTDKCNSDTTLLGRSEAKA
jgi:rfaE bifunctional protein kinase chain/domain